MIQELFPIPIGTYELSRDLTKEEVEFCTNLEWRPNSYNLTSAEADILSKKNLASIREFIEVSLRDYCENTYDAKTDKNEVYITQSWVNLTEQDHHFHNHWHKNSLISGSFYIEVNDEDRIEFTNPHIGSFFNQFFLANSIENFNTYNSNTWWLPAKAGTLYLFPSCIEHGVPAVYGDKNRYSLSFNTFIRGEIGDPKDFTSIVI